MTATEIKKEIYKSKPEAYLKYIRKGSAFYYAELNEKRIYFDIPVNDMGDAEFKTTMDAKLLIRWLVETTDH